MNPLRKTQKLKKDQHIKELTHAVQYLFQVIDEFRARIERLENPSGYNTTESGIIIPQDSSK